MNAGQMLVAMSAEDVLIFTDSQLVAQQVLGNFKVKEERMFQYISKIRKEASQLTSFHIEQNISEGNKETDELACLASSVSRVPEGWVTLLKSELKSIKKEEVLVVTEVNDWREDIICYR